jgi:hypothetical protein
MLQRLLANKHTSVAAIAFIAANIVAKLGAIWFPAYKDQFEATTNLIESAAVGYGLMMAGDAKPTIPTNP